MTLLLIAVLFVILDYTIDFRPPAIQASYRFKVPETVVDQPVFLVQDNLTILLIRRSDRLLAQLSQQSVDLQDPGSDSSRQPEDAKNKLRSKIPQFFVAYALGTDLGCLLQADTNFRLRESCSKASYDYAGRAINGENQYQNLAIPDYNFNQDYSVLTITP